MKFILDQIKKALLDVRSEINLGILSFIDKQLDADYESLAARALLYPDSSEDFIDYYSPRVEEDQKIKKDLLEKYHNELRLIEAAMLVIGQKKKEEAAVLLVNDMQKREKEVKLKEIRLLISRLIEYTDPHQLSLRRDIKAAIAKIEQIDEDRKELRKLVKELKADDNPGCGLIRLSEPDTLTKELVNYKNAYVLCDSTVMYINNEFRRSLLTKNASFKLMQIFPIAHNVNLAATPDYIDIIHACVSDHKSKVIFKMPEALRAIKEQRKKELEAKIKDFKEELSQVRGCQQAEKRRFILKSQLADHVKIQAKIPQGMMDIKKVLSIIKNKIDLKREMQNIDSKLLVDGIPESQRISLTEELDKLKHHLESQKLSFSLEEEEKIKSMFSDLRDLMKSSINDFQAIVVDGGNWDALLHKATGFYWENLSLYRQILLTIDRYLKSASLTDNGRVVALCVTNAILKLRKESEINNALGIISKVDDDLSKQKQLYVGNIRFFDTSGIVIKLIESFKKTSNKFFYFPYNAHVYVLDHPAEDIAGTHGNCHGEAMMFLSRINNVHPTINNICPESDLINYQFNQSTKLKPRTTIIPLGSVDVSEDKRGIRWDDIKDIVMKEVDSKKHGDLCLLKLDGAEMEGSADDVRHRIALIKLKSPLSKYKYVVFDENFGAMGFSDDSQLQEYFSKALEYLLPYRKFKLEIYGEVSDSCKAFIDSIAPIDVDSLTPLVCKRDFWNEKRLMLLAKYGDNSPHSGVRKVLKLEQPAVPEQSVAQEQASAEEASQADALCERKLLAEKIKQQKLLFTKYLDELKIKTNLLIRKKNEGNKKYYEVGVAAKKLNFLLDVASEKFFANPTDREFKAFKKSCESAILNAESEFKHHRSMVGKIWNDSDLSSFWKGIRTILKGIIGVIAILAVIPYFAVERYPKHGFRNIFFADARTDSSEKLSIFAKGAKTVIDDLEKNYPPTLDI